mmetsp:Transcript_19747/g.45984  ORF Transcript_19747/g.45984 Transcript_19747/m.45984 type:complete len:240 (-) Transcript_19747:173-892(-)
MPKFTEASPLLLARSPEISRTDPPGVPVVPRLLPDIRGANFSLPPDICDARAVEVDEVKMWATAMGSSFNCELPIRMPPDFPAATTGNTKAAQKAKMSDVVAVIAPTHAIQNPAACSKTCRSSPWSLESLKRTIPITRHIDAKAWTNAHITIFALEASMAPQSCNRASPSEQALEHVPTMNSMADIHHSPPQGANTGRLLVGLQYSPHVSEKLGSGAAPAHATYSLAILHRLTDTSTSQ